MFISLSAIFALMGIAYSAYKGHADDSDVNAILAAYQSLKNTAVDSCATCHKSEEVPDPEKPRGIRSENSCGYCHAIFVRDKHDVKETLNSYGADYLAAGRGVKAIKAIAHKDSDRDGFPNEVEFFKGTNPGDSASNPAAHIAPHRIFTSAEIRKMSPVVSRFPEHLAQQGGRFLQRISGQQGL